MGVLYLDMDKGWSLVYLVLLFSLLGGVVKTYGGLVYGSQALFVDALTCIANFIAIVATIYFYKIGLKPPDTDHHYGHYRLGYGGPFVSIIAYSFVAGIVVVRLSRFHEYRVEISAPLYAFIGFIFYLAAILLARFIGGFFKAYSVFTVSELIESIVVIATSYVGAVYSYLVDYGGALALTTYLFIELASNTRELIISLSDIAPPTQYVEQVKKFIENWGFKVVSIKIRRVSPKLYHGDIVLKPQNNLDYRTLVDKIKSLKQKLYKEYSIDASIELT